MKFDIDELKATDTGMEFKPTRRERMRFAWSRWCDRTKCRLGRHKWVAYQQLGFSDDRQACITVMRCERAGSYPRHYRLGYAWAKTSTEWEVHF